jgi:hypothetical protein
MFSDAQRPCSASSRWLPGLPSLSPRLTRTTIGVPSWVKVACCGRTDAHHLRPDEVRRNAAGDYVVDIYPWPIAAQLALPSQDGDYWLFFYEDNGVYGRIGCFFVPVLF